MLRDELWYGLLDLSKQYVSNMTEQTPIENIHVLTKCVTARCGSFLNGNHLRFGIAQKALNLFLKYLWCAERIPMPPHWPFDSIVIGKLPCHTWLNWPGRKLIVKNEYVAVVSAAKNVAKGEPLSEWELRIYEDQGLKRAAAKAGSS